MTRMIEPTIQEMDRMQAAADERRRVAYTRAIRGGNSFCDICHDVYERDELTCPNCESRQSEHQENDDGCDSDACRICDGRGMLYNLPDDCEVSCWLCKGSGLREN